MRPRIERGAVLTAALVLLGPACGAAHAGEALYRLPLKAGKFLASYENDGYRMELRESGDGFMLAELRTEPGSRSEAPLPLARQSVPETLEPWLDYSAQPLPPSAVEELRRQLRGAGNADEGIDGLARWVGAKVRYEQGLETQTAADTWMRRRGNCVGRANLLVSMLRMAGLPARTAHGLTLPDADPLVEKHFDAAMLHRWVEVWRPGRGWRFVDPGMRDLRASVLYLPFREIPLMGDLRGWKITALWMEREDGRVTSGLPHAASTPGFGNFRGAPMPPWEGLP